MNKSNLAVTPLPSVVIDKKVTAVIFFSATLCNPQGGAENENAPRVDPDTGCGFITNSGINRKMRDTLEGEGHAIYVTRNTMLDETYSQAVTAFGYSDLKDDAAEDAATEGEELEEPKAKAPKKKGDKPEKRKTIVVTDEIRQDIVKKMCEKYIDIKWFGQVLPKPVPTGVTGPVRTSWALTVDPVNIIPYVPTRVAGIGKEKGMGRSSVVRFGLYRMNITIDPVQARRTNFTWDDLELLKKTLFTMFERTSSATRSGMILEKMFWFTHGGALGSMPVHKLQRRVTTTRKDPEKPPTSMADYEIKIDRAGLAEAHITVEEID